LGAQLAPKSGFWAKYYQGSVIVGNVYGVAGIVHATLMMLFGKLGIERSRFC
jgi:hypothetical protein